MRKPLAFVILLALTACGPAAGEAPISSSTSATILSTTTPSTTTTTAAPTTTSTMPPTTTTMAPTTTTTVLEGNWAEVPVVATASWVGVLGWWDGEDWAKDSGDEPPPSLVGYEFWTVTVESVGRAESSSVQEVCEWFDPPSQMIVLPESSDLEVSIGESLHEGVALSAPWDPVPHEVEVIADDGTHAGFASEILAGMGMHVDTPQIKQVLRVDLEGDGVWEKVVVAEDTITQLQDVSDVYSVVFVRRLVDEEVVTDVLAATVVPPDEEGFGSKYGVGAVADLNGDGVMEIVVSGYAWESSSSEVFELSEDEFTSALTGGCGI